MKIAVIIFLLIIIFGKIRDINRNNKKNIALKALTNAVKDLRIERDSLQEEIGYLKGLEEFCFPVATK